MPTLADFFWPTLESVGPDRTEAADLKAINAARISYDEDLALGEAKRLSREEDDRVKTTEAKASNFLLVSAALVPLLTYLETAIWDAKLGTAPKWTTLPILTIAVAYLAAAAVWALKAVRVSTYYSVGIPDVVDAWNAKQIIKQWLIKETLAAVRKNQAEINAKVSAVKMTYAFMVRAILSFCILLVVQAVAEFSYDTGLTRSVGWFLTETPPNSSPSAHRE